MTTHRPPSCPVCHLPLTIVSETSHAAHSFDPDTGRYTELPGEGEVNYECPTCYADVHDLLPGPIADFQSQDTAP